MPTSATVLEPPKLRRHLRREETSTAKKVEFLSFQHGPRAGASGTKSALLPRFLRRNRASQPNLCHCRLSDQCVCDCLDERPAVKPVSVPATSLDDVLLEIREDLQNSRADIVAKNVELTSAQAAQFWPMFELYQKEQNVVMDDQLKRPVWCVFGVSVVI
jgi:hypothetical protein